MIHGGRMVQANPHSTEIIDLDAQTITNIDHDKRSYSVMTFQQMQQAMADAAAKMKNSKSVFLGQCFADDLRCSYHHHRGHSAV